MQPTGRPSCWSARQRLRLAEEYKTSACIRLQLKWGFCLLGTGGGAPSSVFPLVVAVRIGIAGCIWVFSLKTPQLLSISPARCLGLFRHDIILDPDRTYMGLFGDKP